MFVGDYCPCRFVALLFTAAEVCVCSSDGRNMSPSATEWLIDGSLVTNVHGSQKINPHDFGDPMTFPSV